MQTLELDYLSTGSSHFAGRNDGRAGPYRSECAAPVKLAPVSGLAGADTMSACYQRRALAKLVGLLYQGCVLGDKDHFDGFFIVCSSHYHSHIPVH